MNIIPLGATKNEYFSFNEDGNNNMARARTCEMDATILDTSIAVS